MKLSKEETDLYYRLHWSLLFYVNQKYRVIEGLNEPNLRQENPQKVMELYGKLFSNLGLIDSFATENPFNFNHEELDIIKSWKKYVKDRFLIVAHLKDYSVFMTTGKDQKAYGVLGLTDKIEDVVPPLMPLYLETILFPFKGRIIYCGLMSTYNIQIGSNMRRGIQAEYQQAKRKFGIITSLDSIVHEKEDSEEELLKFYSKNESNRETYCEEIEAIITDNPRLRNVYHREIGSSNAKQIARRFSEIGLAPGWFAIFEDVVIASGKSENEVRAQIADILPDDKKEGAHLFRYRGGKK